MGLMLRRGGWLALFGILLSVLSRWAQVSTSPLQVAETQLPKGHRMHPQPLKGGGDGCGSGSLRGFHPLAWVHVDGASGAYPLPFPWKCYGDRALGLLCMGIAQIRT